MAEDDDTKDVVGYAVWFPFFSTWTGTRGRHLDDLYVRPDARGGGHGRALLAGLLSGEPLADLARQASPVDG
ncbi:GNAT family N-acetyltransferase [Actinoplanes utahensis]|uniref:GNAT family N-acetyltransferase n=1 Tax=Actinoplanes utahensis TaxID=1869 RepID=UPI0035A2511B